MNDVGAVIVGAGEGHRFGKPKSLIELKGRPMFQYSLEPLWNAGITEITVVLRQEDIAKAVKKNAYNPNMWDTNGTIIFIPGGETRAESVINGLNFIRSSWVAIHDVARPLVHLDDINGVIKAAKKYGAAILAHTITDAVRIGSNGFVHICPIHNIVWAAETPQVFDTKLLKEAYKSIDFEPKDDAEVFDQRVFPSSIKIVESIHPNIKITYPRDLELAELLLSA